MANGRAGVAWARRKCADPTSTEQALGPTHPVISSLDRRFVLLVNFAQRALGKIKSPLPGRYAYQKTATAPARDQGFHDDPDIGPPLVQPVLTT
jgi:hypothetical protein